MSSDAVSQTVDPADTLGVLKAARAFLSDPAHWTKGELWRNARGNPVRVSREKVAKCCAIGALSYVAGGTSANEWPYEAAKALGEGVDNPPYSIVHTNDGPDGYGRILAAYDQAIACAEADAA